jgi:hypothetical protein
MKTRKPSLRRVVRELKYYKAREDGLLKACKEYENAIYKLEQKLKERELNSLMKERAQLIQSLSLLTESLSKAIMVTVGKEVM